MSDVKILPKGQPLHKTCPNLVEKPTLLVEEKGNEKSLILQWFGESKEVDVSMFQFDFPINMDVGELFYQPESFETILVGQVKDWPNKEIISNLVEQLGSEDKWIIYAISSKFGVSDGNGGTIPASLLIPMDIMLADENCGVIYPQKFFDDSVRTNAIKKFQED